jgi:L-ornithine N5-oxygenase
VTTEPVWDLLGIGFGPSNIALAIAVAEHNDNTGHRRLNAHFLEKKQHFGWHRGMLLDGATMQVSFLKDLVTLRNPTSRFSFLAYLHDRGRLIDFVNHKCLYPSRIEFHDYLEWCARKLSRVVTYEQEVISARPIFVNGEVGQFEVVAHDLGTGRVARRQARNLVVAPGLRPRLPPKVVAGRRIWHSSTFLDDLARLAVPAPRRFVVLGAGQSAAEVADHLYRRFPTAEVCAVLSRYGYSQSDDSPLANRIFDPETVDVYYGAPEEIRASLLRYHANTNYSVVDVDLIMSIYERIYQEKVLGQPRFRLMNVSELADVTERADGVSVTVRNLATGRCATLEADALVCATGYTATEASDILGEVGALLRRDELNRLCVQRDYRVALHIDAAGGVYLCGGTEHSHGITSSLLSNVAGRADDILRSVLKRAAWSHDVPDPLDMTPATVH